MKFETKISGTKVTEYGDIKPFFYDNTVTLKECQYYFDKQETMDFVLDNFRFTKAEIGDKKEWVCTLDYDTLTKISIMEFDDYAGIRKEFEEHFGKKWLNHYIRFNH